MNVSCMNCLKTMRLVNKPQTGNDMTQSEFHCDVCSNRVKVIAKDDSVTVIEETVHLTKLIRDGWTISYDGEWFLIQDPNDVQYAGTAMEDILRKVQMGEPLIK